MPFARGPMGTTALLLIVAAALPAWSLCSAPTESKRGAAAKARHILFVVGDDNGYNDYGIWNDGKTITPTIDGLIESGIMLADYNTFKICSPSRASILTGRYPWGAGFYDMNEDSNHCTSKFTALPEMLKPLGYKTHALGKWDVGFMKKECTPTWRGYDTFYGYYIACEADYWYHGGLGCPNQGPDDAYWEHNGLIDETISRRNKMRYTKMPTDLSNNTGQETVGAQGANGTYNRILFSNEAARLVRAHDIADPFFMYLAFMNVHDGCGGPYAGKEQGADRLGKQAPMATVNLYNTTQLDCYKVAGAMYTELDYGIAEVVDALKEKEMFDLLIFVSDNGGPLDHTTNSPLRGGKHTFYEGGVRVMSFISGPAVPPARRGTRWTGMAHSSDWYVTITEGIAGGKVPANTGPRAPDGFNLWPAILADSPGPRTEVVHQVENKWSCDWKNNPQKTCSSAIRMGEMKLLVNNPGDSRTIGWPEPAAEPVPFGLTGGELENGTDHARAPGLEGNIYELLCVPYCLFNLTADIGERDDLAANPAFRPMAEAMLARLKFHGSTGGPPAYIWPGNLTSGVPITDPGVSVQFQKQLAETCAAAAMSGFIEPLL